MSKCPDARQCHLSFLPMLERLSPIVNFTLSFIASEPRSNEFRCSHGPDECQGNKQQLCVQDLSSPTTLMRFLQCQSKRYTLIPHNGEQCAKELGDHRISWSSVQWCVQSNRGNQLFHQALERTRRASAKKSCTIHLNGRLWCIHDGGWTQCSQGHDPISLARAICSRYTGKNKRMACGTLL